MPQVVTYSSKHIDRERSEGNGESRQPLPKGRIEGGMLKFPPRVRKRKKEKKDHQAIDRAQFRRPDFSSRPSLRRLFASGKFSLVLGGV